MRFSFRKQPRWVDSGALRWTPEVPLGFAPGGNDDIGWDEPAAPRVWQPEPDLAPRPDSSPPPTAEAALPEPPPQPAPANRNQAPALTAQRLFVGLAQGLLFDLLVLAQAHGIWPGGEPHLYSAFRLALLFAPLLVLEALGRIDTPALLLWSGTAAALLATAGLDAQWWLAPPLWPRPVLAGLVLAAAHGLVRAALTGRGIVPTLAWLVARLCLWALLTGLGFALAAGLLYSRLPAQGGGQVLALAIPPLLALCSALAFTLTDFDKPG